MTTLPANGSTGTLRYARNGMLTTTSYAAATASLATVPPMCPLPINPMVVMSGRNPAPQAGIPAPLVRDEGQLEGVARGAVHVAAVLDGPAAVVVGGAGHREQRRAARFAEQPGLGGVGLAGADGLVGHPQLYPGVAQDLVEPAPGEQLGGEVGEAGRQVVAHDGQRLVLRVPQPFDRDDGRTGGHVQRRGDVVRCGYLGEGQHLGAGLPVRVLEVVVQAAQLHLPADPGPGDLGADAPLADQQPFVDQVLDRLAHGRQGRSRSPAGSRASARRTRSAPGAAGPPGSTAARGWTGRLGSGRLRAARSD